MHYGLGDAEVNILVRCLLVCLVNKQRVFNYTVIHWFIVNYRACILWLV